MAVPPRAKETAAGQGIDLDAAGSIYEDRKADVRVAGEATGEEELARIEELVHRSPAYDLVTLTRGCETEIESTEH